jgi:transposase
VIRTDLALRRLRTTVAQVRARSFPYVSRPLRRRNWRLYDLAQTHELEEVLRLIRLIVATDLRECSASSLPSSPRGGRPRVPLADLLVALLWQSYRGSANRPTEGDLRVLDLGLSRRFSYKTLERAYSLPDVVAALPRLLQITNRPLVGLETIFSIDGSGFPTTVRAHYRTERERQNGSDREAGYLPQGPHAWVRNVADVGVRFVLVAGWKSWVEERLPEVHCFAEVFDQTRSEYPGMTQQLGDGMYAIRWVVAHAAERGVTSRFLPRRNVKLMAYRATGWKPSLWGLVVNPQGWLAEYHLRSVSESVWGAMKARQSRKILKRLGVRQEVEATLRAITYNLRRLAYLKWTEAELSLNRIAG